MTGTIDRGLDVAWRLAGGAVLGLALGMLAASSCACGPQPSPSCPVRTDDTETPVELSTGDACHRAGLRLQKLGCKEWRADWDAFCREMQAQHVPICAVKLSRVATCAEVDRVCR